MENEPRKGLAAAMATMQRELNGIVASRTGDGELNMNAIEERFESIHEGLDADTLATAYRDAEPDDRASLKIHMIALKDLSELIVALGETPGEVLMVEVA